MMKIKRVRLFKFVKRSNLALREIRGAVILSYAGIETSSPFEFVQNLKCRVGAAAQSKSCVGGYHLGTSA
jgi:hypothetical protein